MTMRPNKIIAAYSEKISLLGDGWRVLVEHYDRRQQRYFCSLRHSNGRRITIYADAFEGFLKSYNRVLKFL